MVSSKRDNENYSEYQQRVLDTKSKSFCGAKWYNATIWLGSGQTTSCHHPLPHQIDLESIKRNPSAIHNTSQKKMERLMMQSGDRPAGCEYCWRLEDAGTTSDRVHKSKIFSEQELDAAFHMNATHDVNLRTLEISFDRTCQFACSYCNPAFSTTWAKDIKNAGPYTELYTDGRGHFSHDHAHSQRYRYDEVNPYAEAFFRWWDQGLHKDLRELRITGGEPLMSGYTWKLLEWFNNTDTDCKLAINSNLGFDEKKMQEFFEKTSNIKGLEIYTSNEATRLASEYIRDGLYTPQWYCNVNNLIDRNIPVHVMATINALCIPTLPEFLEIILKKKKHDRDAINFTLNILRFPSFQSLCVLPREIRENCSIELAKLFEYDMHDMEREHIKRLIIYLTTAETPHEGASPREELVKDFKSFYTQYDARRGKNFAQTFPELKDWYNDIRL